MTIAAGTKAPEMQGFLLGRLLAHYGRRSADDTIQLQSVTACRKTASQQGSTSPNLDERSRPPIQRARADALWGYWGDQMLSSGGNGHRLATTHRLSVIVCVFAQISLFGCAGLQLEASPAFPEMVENFPFRADQPIAREIHYTYVSDIVLDGKSKPWYAADQATMDGNDGEPHIPLPTAVTHASRSLSEDYSRRGREASKQGDHSTAQMYHGLAESSLRAQQSLDRSISTVETTIATYVNLNRAGSAWVKAETKLTASKLRDWVIYGNRAIGSAAPEGSVIQLDIRNIFEAEKFQLESRRDFLVTATLLDARGRLVVGGAGWQLFGLKREGSKLPVPDDLVVIGRGSVSDEKQELMASIANQPYGYFLLITVDAAIANLYEQLRLRDGAPYSTPFSTP